MKRKHGVAGLVAGGLLIAAASAAAASGTAGTPLVSEGISIELGRRDYRNYCAACHGTEGKGDGTLAEFLTLAVPDITQLSKLNSGKFPEERVTEVIDGRAEVKVHGMRDMPVWGDWFDSEAISQDTDRDTRELIVQDRIQSLVGYIKSIQAK
ncbi:c-type cytochrome [Aestuariivirga sp.]|uniref:c-type cytochrome n=1 Tax=Aestuariivirga sp. TaxID=2650926 RepID=UPI00391D1082